MSKSTQQALEDSKLTQHLEKLLLHDETCTLMPDPQGCSCGALLARLDLKSFIKQREVQAHEDGFVAGFLAGRNIPQGDVEQLDYDEAVLAHKIYSPSYFNRDVKRLSLTTNKEKKS